MPGAYAASLPWPEGVESDWPRSWIVATALCDWLLYALLWSAVLFAASWMRRRRKLAA